MGAVDNASSVNLAAAVAAVMATVDDVAAPDVPDFETFAADAASAHALYNMDNSLVGAFFVGLLLLHDDDFWEKERGACFGEAKGPNSDSAEEEKKERLPVGTRVVEHVWEKRPARSLVNCFWRLEEIRFARAFCEVSGGDARVLTCCFRNAYIS